MRKVYYGHGPNAKGEREPLKVHLEAVARMAASFADSTPLKDEAYLAGLLHDLGKYGELFQKRLEGEAHGVDHWSIGAWIALEKCRSVAAAVAIDGHHLGLKRVDKEYLKSLNPRNLAENHPINLKLSESDEQKLISLMEADGLVITPLSRTLLQFIPRTASAMLDIRMLFSMLVDADFLAAEAHFQDDTHRPAGLSLEPGRALRYLMAYVDKVRAASNATKEMRELRDDLLNTALCAAEAKTNIWTLTAPTGVGKTLAMLAFALKHAEFNNLRRVIFVIPYLTVIEQMANEYRKIFDGNFGENYILEHHSLAEVESDLAQSDIDLDFDNDRIRSRKLLAENWDAPIIITTSVQMLESLFSNRVSTCRKLHRLAKSVILFDEVQTLPQRLVVPTLATLAHLSTNYGSSIVFATATQPAFTSLSECVAQLMDSKSGWKPVEIVPNNLSLFSRARRTITVWPNPDEKVDWDTLAEKISSYKQVLCVVNLKRHALELIRKLRDRGIEGIKHLSTSMCPAHRMAVLSEVRKSLRDNSPCRLVSTQCVEAGVDIDFLVVFRAMGPLESIVQAAGRCNREGKASKGYVHIFIPEDEAYPDTAYKQAAEVTYNLLRERGPEEMDIHNVDLLQDYYNKLYSICRPQDSDRARCLNEAIECSDFEEVARLYRIIDKNTVNLLVPYDQSIFDELADEVRKSGLNSRWIRRARPYTISIFYPDRDSPIWQRMEKIRIGQREYALDWFIYLDASDYSEEVGFIPPEADSIIIA